MYQRDSISIEEVPNIDTTLRSVATAQSYTGQGFKKCSCKKTMCNTKRTLVISSNFNMRTTILIIFKRISHSELHTFTCLGTTKVSLEQSFQAALRVKGCRDERRSLDGENLRRALKARDLDGKKERR
ncbi:hypothetical protein TNCV_1418761 [Trichonephila clavipes]|nr:hypothetical protein TNCV_1418761 [Trichonephila clavipes]